MARKASPETPSTHGFHDIIGLVLMGSAALLLVALLSYNPHDVSANVLPVNHPARNWIGPFGAWMAYYWFYWIGAGAYVAPFLLLVVGLGCFFEHLAYLRRRWVWALILLVCCLGLFELYKGLFSSFGKKVSALPGGILGTNFNQHILLYFGRPGATIILLTLYLICLLYLTNFRLGEWVRSLTAGPPGGLDGPGPASGETTNEEKILEKRARELEKQARKLQEQVEKARAGIGADLKPVPEPTVRDLSVPQNKPAPARPKKPVAPEPAKEPAPPDEAVVIPAREVAAATTAEIIGKKLEPPGKPAEIKADEAATVPPGDEKPADVPGEPAVETVPAAPIAKSKPTPRKPKPIAVAATPRIGNYQLPTLDFLKLPDLTVKPTESKEELMANARLMQKTLAQFDIDVSLG
ncbi:MAG TPA: DNA translocase FtsK 4TM domain-containing protein, partial [Verrucomicrobiae bacterium]|nr:DNA translocase FtsK 4TM domain-containing protein [Verrucomicrobiae bacterium]